MTDHDALDGPAGALDETAGALDGAAGALEETALRRAPKVLLHDHLDGGLRPSTIRELAAEIGHTLPVDLDAARSAADAQGRDPDAAADEAIAAWFFQGGRGADLERYLDAFAHTVALLQTPEALERVARECAEDLDADGVIYAEVRYAPELSTATGLPMSEVIAAIARGFAAGPATITVRQLVCGMRQADQVGEAFAAAAEARHLGVVGVDLAGPEQGYPAGRFATEIEAAREAGLRLTLHAGEAAGPESIAEALAQGAERLGHGVRIIDDVEVSPDYTVLPGPVAGRVLARGMALEVCPTSNVHTGVCPSVATHPFNRLRDAGFVVTVNTDNRLMSQVTASGELAALVGAFGYDVDDLEELALDAADAAFCVDEAERGALREQIVRGYAALRA